MGMGGSGGTGVTACAATETACTRADGTFNCMPAGSTCPPAATGAVTAVDCAASSMMLCVGTDGSTFCDITCPDGNASGGMMGMNCAGMPVCMDTTGIEVCGAATGCPPGTTEVSPGTMGGTTAPGTAAGGALNCAPSPMCKDSLGSEYCAFCSNPQKPTEFTCADPDTYACPGDAGFGGGNMTPGTNMPGTAAGGLDGGVECDQFTELFCFGVESPQCTKTSDGQGSCCPNTVGCPVTCGADQVTCEDPGNPEFGIPPSKFCEFKNIGCPLSCPAGQVRCYGDPSQTNRRLQATATSFPAGTASGPATTTTTVPPGTTPPAGTFPAGGNTSQLPGTAAGTFPTGTADPSAQGGFAGMMGGPATGGHMQEYCHIGTVCPGGASACGPKEDECLDENWNTVCYPKSTQGFCIPPCPAGTSWCDDGFGGGECTATCTTSTAATQGPAAGFCFGQCVDKSKSEADCMSQGAGGFQFWNDISANGNGLCEKSAWTKSECEGTSIAGGVAGTAAAMVPAGTSQPLPTAANTSGGAATGSSKWTWFPGRMYLPGMHDTAETCTGTCLGAYYEFGSEPKNKAECEALGSCSSSCVKCESQEGAKGKSVCIILDSTITKDTCTADKFKGFKPVWDEQESFCHVRLNKKQCGDVKSFKTQYQECSLLKGPNCQACESGSANCKVKQNYLKCFQNPFGKCTKDECLANGQCSDWELQGGACIQPFSYGNGFQECDAKYWFTPIGCKDPQITTKAACTSPGKWVESAKNEKTCKSHSACRQPGAWDLTPLNPEECKKCGGQGIALYDWYTGDWIVPEWLNLTWKPRAYESTNSFGPAIDPVKLDDALNVIVAVMTAGRIKTSMFCRYNTDFLALAQLACSCDPTADQAVCKALEATAVPVLQAVAIEGQTDKSNSDGTRVEIDANAAANGSSVEIIVDKAPLNTIKNQNAKRQGTIDGAGKTVEVGECPRGVAQSVVRKAQTKGVACTPGCIKSVCSCRENSAYSSPTQCVKTTTTTTTPKRMLQAASDAACSEYETFVNTGGFVVGQVIGAPILVTYKGDVGSGAKFCAEKTIKVERPTYTAAAWARKEGASIKMTDIPVIENGDRWMCGKFTQDGAYVPIQTVAAPDSIQSMMCGTGVTTPAENLASKAILVVTVDTTNFDATAQTKFIGGLAVALGVPAGNIRLISVGGVPVRRRLAESAVEFEVKGTESANAEVLAGQVTNLISSGALGKAELGVTASGVTQKSSDNGCGSRCAEAKATESVKLDDTTIVQSKEATAKQEETTTRGAVTGAVGGLANAVLSGASTMAPSAVFAAIAACVVALLL
eukprot:GFYU01001852.1.p1 GENE.GFYU01001852.1~~GFYU01001852.1.p1  ORF type:complete len:1518 (+),score=504.43 GFYU01001852.1:604-4554(+)